jgi:hypothetical protein
MGIRKRVLQARGEAVVVRDPQKEKSALSWIKHSRFRRATIELPLAFTVNFQRGCADMVASLRHLPIIIPFATSSSSSSVDTVCGCTRWCCNLDSCGGFHVRRK